MLLDRNCQVGENAHLVEPHGDARIEQHPLIAGVERVGVGAAVVKTVAFEQLQDRPDAGDRAELAEIVGDPHRAVELVAGPVVIAGHDGDLVAGLDEPGERAALVKGAHVIGAEHRVGAARAGQAVAVELGAAQRSVGAGVVAGGQLDAETQARRQVLGQAGVGRHELEITHRPQMSGVDAAGGASDRAIVGGRQGAIIDRQLGHHGPVAVHDVLRASGVEVGRYALVVVVGSRRLGAPFPVLVLVHVAVAEPDREARIGVVGHEGAVADVEDAATAGAGERRAGTDCDGRSRSRDGHM